MNEESAPADPLAIQQPCRRYGLEEAIHPVQIAAFRQMTPAQKMAQVVEMYHTGISLMMAGLQMQHPDWTDEELRRAAQRISTYGVLGTTLLNQIKTAREGA